MSVPFELFLSGLMLGVGPCSAFCLPILIPYVAGTREGLAEGVKATLAFSLSRLSAYTLLGFVAGFSGEVLISFLVGTDFGFYMWLVGGAFLFMLGLLILLGREVRIAPHRLLFRHAVDDSLKSMALVGFLVGVNPCAPLIGILTYIAFSVKNPVLGSFYAICFGLGASVITPILVVGIISGVAPRLIFRTPRIYEAFKRSCGFLLILFGVKLIVSQIIGDVGYW